MKIQYLAIIFLIIVLPMTLLLTIYNQSQVNNLSLQLDYNSYLSDATHSAIKAFEINTVKNSFSEVADSLKRDVEAAVNVFLSSMANSLGTSGASTEAISEYVPAILFTLYDGYYIYAPAHSEELITNTVKKESISGAYENVIVAESQTPPELTFSHILKPYVYYTMRYVKGSANATNPTQTDFIVNYTLDNYMTVYGKVNGDYVTKSGYLVQLQDKNTIKLSGNNDFVTVDIDEEKLLAVLKRDILTYVLSLRELDNASMDYINNKFSGEGSGKTEKQYLENIKRIINFELEGVYRTSLISNMGQTLLDNILDGKYDDGTAILDLADIPVSKIAEQFENEVERIGISGGGSIDKVIDCFSVKYNNTEEITDYKAKLYYVKALQFTNWINKTLSDIEVQFARDSKGQTIESFENNTTKIFKTNVSDDNNPEDIKSPFVQHKNEVIKQSIQSNLTASIARYNQNFFGLKHGYDLKMPVLDATEWEAITNNVTMVSFMQGMIVGNKVFNDYAIVSSDTNKEMVDVENIYYFNRKSLNESTEYHTIDCENLRDELNDPKAEIVGYNLIDYELQTVKDEEGVAKPQFADSIRRELFDVTVDQYGNESITTRLKTNIKYLLADYECLVDRNYEPDTVVRPELLLAKYTAIGRLREEHYKVNGYLDSYEIQFKKKNIVLTPSITEWTNSDVMISVVSDVYDLEYWFESDPATVISWPLVTNGITGEVEFDKVTVSNNNTIYVRSKTDTSKVASLEISNIDKDKPRNIRLDKRQLNSDYTLTLEIYAEDASSGIAKYEIEVSYKNDPAYRPYRDSKVTKDVSVEFITSRMLPDEPYEIKVKVTDEAGNTTEKIF